MVVSTATKSLQEQLFQKDVPFLQKHFAPNLKAALMKGRKVSEIARTTGVEVTTLRTQLSAILRKVGVERQVDLVRVLSSVGSTDPHSA